MYRGVIEHVTLEHPFEVCWCQNQVFLSAEFYINLIYIHIHTYTGQRIFLSFHGRCATTRGEHGGAGTNRTDTGQIARVAHRTHAPPTDRRASQGPLSPAARLQSVFRRLRDGLVALVPAAWHEDAPRGRAAAALDDDTRRLLSTHSHQQTPVPRLDNVVLSLLRRRRFPDAVRTARLERRHCRLAGPSSGVVARHTTTTRRERCDSGLWRPSSTPTSC